MAVIDTQKNNELLIKRKIEMAIWSSAQHPEMVMCQNMHVGSKPTQSWLWLVHSRLVLSRFPAGHSENPPVESL